jgi:hypothetical protein
MTSGYLAPTDSWPRHPRPAARVALSEARAKGWWLEPVAGHAFGRLRCAPPGGDSPSDACVMLVWSTSGPRDGSDTARHILDGLRKCTHDQSTGPPLGPEDYADRAEVALDRVDAFLDAADNFHAMRLADEEADEAISAAIDHLDQFGDAGFERMDQWAAEADIEASRQRARALAAAARAGVDDPWPPQLSADELLDLAANTLRGAVDLVAAAEGSGVEQKLAAGLGRLEERAKVLASVFAGSS